MSTIAPPRDSTYSTFSLQSATLSPPLVDGRLGGLFGDNSLIVKPCRAIEHSENRLVIIFKTAYYSELGRVEYANYGSTLYAHARENSFINTWRF